MEMREWRRLAFRSAGLLVFVLLVTIAGNLSSQKSFWQKENGSGQTAQTQKLSNIEHVEAHVMKQDELSRLGEHYIEISKTVTGQAISVRLDNDYVERTMTLTMKGASVRGYGRTSIKYHGGDGNFRKEEVIKKQKVSQTHKTARFTFCMNRIYEPELLESEDVCYIVLRRPKEVYSHVVVIDAGHGGDDEGTGSVDWKYREKDSALKIVGCLKQILDGTDIKAYYTRLDDRDISKRDRVRLAKDAGADVLISVHCNASDAYDTTAKGVETLYSGRKKTTAGNLSSRQLAKDILDEVCETTGRQRRKVIRRDQLYLMHHADVPVTIVEVGYMTNRSDMRYLKKQKNQREIAQGIYNGLCKSLQRIEK